MFFFFLYAYGVLTMGSLLDVTRLRETNKIPCNLLRKA